MLQIQQTATLFSGLKIFSITNNVENKNTEAVKAVLVYENISIELAKGFQEMLDNLMKACKFNTQDVLFLNYKHYEVSIGQIQSRFNPELILLFGEIEGSKNMTKFQKNIAYEMNGTKIIRTESLQNLEKVKGEKIKLWQILQQTLNIVS